MAPRGPERAGYAPAPQYADDGDRPGDEWSGLSTMCCEPAPAADGGGEGEDAGWRHVHVGQGRGKYEKVHSYRYVGEGAGSFHREEIVSYRPTSKLRPECVCLMLVTMILLLIVLWPRIYSLWPSGAVEGAAGAVVSPLLGTLTNGSNATETVEGSLVVDNLSYEDVVGDAALNDSLASTVEKAVASEATRAVQAEQPIQPSQVRVTSASAVTNTSVGMDFVITALPLGRADAVAAGLSDTDSVESSIASHLAADATVQTAATGSVGVSNFTLYFRARKSTSASTTAAASSSASTTAAGPLFDCDIDYTECYDCLTESWSPAKLTWCCDHQARGCESTTTSVVYDCMAGYDNWRRGWSNIKKQFCCESQDRGCETGDNAFERDGNTSILKSIADNISGNETSHAATGEGFPGSGNVNVSNASNVPESASNLTDIGDFDGDSENMTEGSHSNATHASHLINHVANSTNATNASAAQPPNKSSSPSVAGDGARGPDTTTDSSANDTKIWAD